MDRRNAIAIAVAAGGTMLAAGAAVAANVGLLEEERDPVGQLEPLNVGALLPRDGSSPTTPETIVIDVPADARAPSGGTAGAGSTPLGGGSDDDASGDDQGDDEYDDDHGYDDEDDDGHEDDEDDGGHEDDEHRDGEDVEDDD
jgi:hypothetical protein